MCACGRAVVIAFRNAADGSIATIWMRSRQAWLRASSHPVTAAPVVELYRALNAQDGCIIAEDSSAQELLGLRPRPIEQWLKDLAVS